MRKEFCQWVESYAKRDDKVIFLTGDLGFAALESLRDAIGDRFINCGVAEQNMISLASGLAAQGLKPLCYSIAPFCVFRPAEQIRVDVCLHKMNVKIIGNGGGYGYGIMGATHHAIEDLAVLSSFPNMSCFIPLSCEDVPSICEEMIAREGPSYLRLGAGSYPSITSIPYCGLRQLQSGTDCTVVALGPLVTNVFKSGILSEYSIDFFGVSEIPLIGAINKLIQSIQKTRKLVVIEEHVQRGGVAEYLANMILASKSGELLSFCSLFAKGYPDGKYGNQLFHQEKSGLDPKSIAITIKGMMEDVQ